MSIEIKDGIIYFSHNYGTFNRHDSQYINYWEYLQSNGDIEPDFFNRISKILENITLYDFMLKCINGEDGFYFEESRCVAKFFYNKDGVKFGDNFTLH